MRHVQLLLLFLVASLISSILPSAHSGLCPTGWHSGPVEGKCFSLESYGRRWEEAERECKNKTGHLAAITAKEELLFVQQLCSTEPNGCWVGGRGQNSSKGFDWVWSDRSIPWNDSVFPGAPSKGSKCLNSSTSACEHNDLSQLCTLVTNGTEALVGDICNETHALICSLNEGWRCQFRSCHREYFVILGVVSSLIATTTVGVIVWLLVYRQNKRQRRSSNSVNFALVPQTWRVFTSDELRVTTKNFSDANRLGGDARTGGMYRGVLPDGSLIAIKRLKKSSFHRKKDVSLQSKKEYLSQCESEFQLEVGRIARYRHPNIVAVKGCCFKQGQRFIVYEYLANGPLDRWLHRLPKGARSLDWGVRMRIAVTIAQGIAFLHDKVKPHVVHCDIRASNVLLDEDFRAHILGVGLSKFVPWEVMHERTVMAGTYGYLAPEFVYRNELTTKSDVYSFGVLLLELLSAREPVQTVECVGWQSIFEWATPLVQSQSFTQLLDPSISSIPDPAQIQKVIDLVYACTQHVPSMRPRMSYVLHQLQQVEAVVVAPRSA